MTDQPITWTRSYNTEVREYEYRANFMVDDIEVYLTGTQFGGRKSKKTRVYVSGEPKVDFSEAERLSKEAGSLGRGASVEADKAWDSANRALVQSKKDFLEALIHTIPVLGEVLSDHKLNFNRKAGCSCGCSPGFVADASSACRSAPSGGPPARSAPSAGLPASSRTSSSS